MSDQDTPQEITADSLTDILNGQEPAPAEEQTPEPPEDEPKAEEEQPKGEEPPAETPEEEGEPPAPEDEDGKTVPLKALHDERSKRQDLERRLQQLEQQRNQQQEPAKAPDPIDDPEGYQQYQDQRALNDRIELSLEIGREMHQDFDDVAKAFYEEAEKNPLLAQQAIQNKAPGLFMYREGQKILRNREIGDPETYAAQKVAEATGPLEARIKELEAKLESESKRSQIPPSLAGDRSVGSRGAPEEPVDVPISALLNE
ncbi:MAG: hypothetical protein CMI02_07400 [Oceanospirillaceae bacterium]|nr:hypothetical protein [Oceanospirillaceae bacterium]